MPTKKELNELLEKHKPIIAERWRRLDELMKTFYGEFQQEPTGKEVAIEPVAVYPAKTVPGEKRHQDDEPDPVVIGFEKTITGRRGRKLAADAYAKLTYDDDDKTNKSIKCYGIVGAPMRLIKLAQQVNQAKDEFKDAIAPISNRRMHVGTTDVDGKPKKLTRELSTLVLRQIQRSDVNLLAAYRHIPVVTEAVDEFRFMYVQTRSIARKTVQQLIDKLDVDPGATALEDLQRLRGLERDEFLVRAGEYYNRMRVRIVYPRRVPVKKYPHRTIKAYEIRHAELPLLFPMTHKVRRPTVLLPKFKELDRKARPQQMEDELFVMSLRFRRMKPQYRKYKRDEEEKSLGLR